MKLKTRRSRILLIMRERERGEIGQHSEEGEEDIILGTGTTLVFSQSPGKMQARARDKN